MNDGILNAMQELLWLYGRKRQGEVLNVFWPQVWEDLAFSLRKRK